MKVAALLIVVVSLCGCAREPQPAPPVAKPATFLHNGVTAHRGFSGRYPENTMPAFGKAIEAGADWIECDIFKTADGRLVVAHDKTTGRVADVDVDVTQATYEELRPIDVAAKFRKSNDLSLAGCPPQHMPLLEEAIALVMSQHRTRLSIQPKQDITDEAIAVIRRMNAHRWVGFNEGKLSRLTRVKELEPAIPVFYDTGGVFTPLHVENALKHGFEAIVMRERDIGAGDVQRVRAAGLEVGAWTVNDPDHMRRLLDLGVYRIYTDHPDVLLRIKAERGRGR